MRLDAARLDAERLEALKAILPAPAEADTCKRAPQADDELGKCERFFRAATRVKVHAPVHVVVGRVVRCVGRVFVVVCVVVEVRSFDSERSPPSVTRRPTNEVELRCDVSRLPSTDPPAAHHPSPSRLNRHS